SKDGFPGPINRPHPRSHARWRCEEGSPSSPAPSGGRGWKRQALTLARTSSHTATIGIVISSELLEVLACPRCKQKIELSEDGQVLICQSDRLRYPIVDGIPVMLVEEAESF